MYIYNTAVLYTMLYASYKLKRKNSFALDIVEPVCRLFHIVLRCMFMENLDDITSICELGNYYLVAISCINFLMCITVFCLLVLLKSW